MRRLVLSSILLLVFVSARSHSAEPSTDEIPIIGQRFAPWCWSPLLLCRLAWSHFDGFETQLGAGEGSSWADLLETAGDLDLLVIITPTESYQLTQIDNNDTLNRAHYRSLDTGNAFFSVDEYGENILAVFPATETEDELEDLASALSESYSDFSALWCWKLMDEAPTAQRSRMFDSSYVYDEYFPNMFPCEFPADTGMLVTDSASVYAWLKWALEHEDTGHPTTTVFAGMPYIEEWAGNDTIHFPGVPSPHIHASIVRAFAGMRYQDYPISGYPNVFNNFPGMLQVDVYPFRQVGTEYQDSMSYTPCLGDSLNTWLLDHSETGMDSTFIPAVGEGLALHYFVQAFGKAGGVGPYGLWVWNQALEAYVLSYISYAYRAPTPAEFRMSCNLALMRQADGIFPYSLMSYSEGDPPWYSASLLDGDMVPWDAPFEEYCYRHRSQDSTTYTRPDYIPPFQEGFDPLYDGPGTPPGISGQRAREAFMEWKFAPYGRLWDSMGETLGGIAVMAPELAGLRWWDEDGHPDAVDVDCEFPGDHFVEPECRVFEGGSESSSYIFYVNRYCRDTTTVFGVSFAASDLPFPSQYALDHGRRFIIPNANMYDDELFGFADTLGPGEARLVELIEYDVDADLRITSPDVYVTRPPSIVESHEFLFTAGDTVHLHGTIYNLGTEGAAGVEVTLTDLGDSTVLDRDTLGFEGLDRDGCVTDDATADFVWVTGSGDIGAHLLEIAAEDVGSEDEGDNSVRIPVLVEPRDYATEVRGDPWDMLEAESSPPGWMTNDIEAVSGDWVSSCWTDSVGGMYEGALDPETTSPHRAEISLAIPPDSSRWIDAGIYDMLGFGGAWYSPYLPEDAQCGMYVMWRDSEGDLHGWFSLDTSQGLLKNGWQEYREVRGIDLGEVDGAEGSWRGMIPELWIRFQTTQPILEEEEAMPIRLSRILLEESGD